MATTVEPPPDAPTDDLDKRRQTQRRLVGGAGFMMACILLSRLLGLVRDRVIAHQFGQGFETDVYNAAFTIPDLLFFLLAGGALSASFIPVFVEYWESSKPEEAWRVFSVVAAMMTVIMSVCILFGEIFTTPLVQLTNPGYDAAKVEATVRLTRILLPAQICFFLGGLMMGTLTARNILIGQGLAPVIYNLFIILGGVFLTRTFGVAGLCWGAVIGAILGNLVFQWVLVRRSGGRFITHDLWKNRNHPGVRDVWKLMLPVILGLALPQITTIIGRMFAASLGDGPQSALMNANRLMQVPLGVFAQATGIAIFPTLAAQAARNEMGEMQRSLVFGIRSILFLTIPSSLVMIVLALPIVQLLLQSGKFRAEDAALTASVLRYYAIGIFAVSAHAVLTRGFYALKDTRTPVVIGAVVGLLFIALNWPLRAWMQVEGLALATSIASILLMTALLIRLRLRLGGLGGAELVRGIVQMTAAGAVMTLACYLTRWLLESWLAGRTSPVMAQAALVLGVCLPVSALVYGGMATLLRMDEARAVWRRLARFLPS